MPSISTPSDLRRAAILLAVVQFFFFTTWIVYATYLGDLLDRIGIDRSWLLWFILFDQIVFAFSDTAMGYTADRIERLIGRLGPIIIGINAVSCLAFLLLPFSAEMRSEAGQGLFIFLILTWIGTSSVLRAPPLVLLMKHAARPQAPKLAAISLLGLALGGAVSPYLGTWLKQIDPAIPFVVTALTLFATTLGLVWVQRIVSALPPTERTTQSKRPAAPSKLALLLIATLLIAFGFQIHGFLNAKPQYLQFLSQADLVWVLPLFWVGFKLLVFPGASAARRYGPERVMAIAATTGALALAGATIAPNLETLIAAQMIAGGAWGILFMAGISAALGMGTNGREGMVLGLWFTMISAAAVVRVAFVLMGAKTDQAMAPLLTWGPIVTSTLGASILALLAWRMIKRR